MIIMNTVSSIIITIVNTIIIINTMIIIVIIIIIITTTPSYCQLLVTIVSSFSIRFAISISVFTSTQLPMHYFKTIKQQYITFKHRYYELHAPLKHLFYQHQCLLIFLILRSYWYNKLSNIVNSVNGRRFLAEYGRLIKDAYPVSNVQNSNYRTGKYLTLFPFKRMFVVCRIWPGRLTDWLMTDDNIGRRIRGKLMDNFVSIFHHFCIYFLTFWYYF